MAIIPIITEVDFNELINKIGIPIQQIIWELHKEKGTKAILSHLRLFDIRIKRSIRLLIEVELLFHAWLNRSEVNSIKNIKFFISCRCCMAVVS